MKTVSFTINAKNAKEATEKINVQFASERKTLVEEFNGNVRTLFDNRVMGYTDKKRMKSSAVAYDIKADITINIPNEKPIQETRFTAVAIRSFVEKDKRENAKKQLEALSDLSVSCDDISKAVHAVKVYLNCLYLTDIAEKIENNDVHRILKHSFTLDKCGNGKATPGAVATAIERTVCRLYKGLEYIDINDLQAEAKAKAKAEKEAEKAEAKAEAERIKAEAKAEAERIKAEANTKAKEAKKGNKAA